MNSLDLVKYGNLWYPIMLAEEFGEITESKAVELLGITIEEYRDKKWKALQAVRQFIKDLPSPLVSIIDAIKKEEEQIITPKKSPQSFYSFRC